MNQEFVDLARAFASQVAELVRKDIARQVLNAPVQAAHQREPRGPRRITAAKLLQTIRDNPGKRVEEISLVLSMPTSELKGPLRQLVAARVLRTQGEARGTRYFERASQRKRRR